MKLYQAGYFRKGKQGSNAGWNIVSPSEGMSKVAKDGFQGLAANLTELKRKGAMPVTNLGVFLYDRFVYLLHVNYAASGEDARGVTYVHGYCFNLSDYYDLCAEPSRLCGILDENFQMEYDESIRAYPVAESFATEGAFDFDALIRKYHLTEEEYRKLVLGALCAMEGSTDTLCIKCDVPLEEYKQVYREMLYLIMKGLPFHLRVKVSGFSYKGAKAAIYLSNKTEGSNYADLDSHEFVCDTAKVSLCRFTELYNIQFAKSAVRDNIFAVMADFMNKVFENPLKETGYLQVEAAYQAKIRKNRTGGISAQAAPELLQNFIGCNLTTDEETYAYLTELLRLINESGYEITDRKVRNRLQKFYEKASDAQYKAEIDRYFAANAVKQGKKGYKVLSELQEFKAQFASVCHLVRDMDEAYYTEYYEKEYLPGRLTDLDKLDTFMSGDQGEFMTPRGYEAALKIFKRLIFAEIETADNFDKLQKIQKRANGLLFEFMDRISAQTGSVLGEVYQKFWEQFDLTWFDPERVEDYKECKVDVMAARNENAAAVSGMMRLVKSDFEENQEFLIKLLMSDEILQDKGEKETIQKMLRKEFKRAGNWRTSENLDLFLCLYYDCGIKLFDTLSWCKDCYKKKCETSVFSPMKVRERIEGSSLLQETAWRDIFVDSLEGDIRDAKKEDFTKEQIKGLKLYYNCLMGKDIDAGHGTSSGDNYFDSIHRIFIGLCTLAAIGTGLYSALNYYGNKTASVVLFAVFAVLCLGVSAAKIILSGGFGDMAEHTGLSSDEPSKMAAYFGTIAVMLLMCILIYFLSKVLDSSGQFIFRITGLGIFGLLGLISAIVYFIKAEE